MIRNARSLKVIFLYIPIFLVTKRIKEELENEILIEKITAIIFVTCLCAIGFDYIPPALGEEIMPCYNNTESATISMRSDDSGTMTILYRVTGCPSKTTKILISPYIEKRTLGILLVVCLSVNMYISPVASESVSNNIVTLEEWKNAIKIEGNGEIKF